MKCCCCKSKVETIDNYCHKCGASLLKSVQNKTHNVHATQEKRAPIPKDKIVKDVPISQKDKLMLAKKKIAEKNKFSHNTHKNKNFDIFKKIRITFIIILFMFLAFLFIQDPYDSTASLMSKITMIFLPPLLIRYGTNYLPRNDKKSIDLRFKNLLAAIELRGILYFTLKEKDLLYSIKKNTDSKINETGYKYMFSPMKSDHTFPVPLLSNFCHSEGYIYGKQYKQNDGSYILETSNGYFLYNKSMKTFSKSLKSNIDQPGKCIEIFVNYSPFIEDEKFLIALESTIIINENEVFDSYEICSFFLF